MPTPERRGEQRENKDYNTHLPKSNLLGKGCAKGYMNLALEAPTGLQSIKNAIFNYYFQSFIFWGQGLSITRSHKYS